MRASNEDHVDRTAGQRTRMQGVGHVLWCPVLDPDQCKAFHAVADDTPRTSAEASSSGDPDRHTRLHTRRRRHAAASARHGVATQHRKERLDRGVDRDAPRPVVRRRLIERRVLAVAVDSEADAEHHPTRRQSIERRRRLSHELRPPPGQGRDHRPDPHPLSGHGDRRQRDERIGERGERPVPQVVPDEEPVPAGTLRGDRHLGDHCRICERFRERN